jgi:hypothetical protein
MTTPTIQALGITQEGPRRAGKPPALSMAWAVEAWGTSLIEAMEALQALTARRVAEQEQEGALISQRRGPVGTRSRLVYA